MHFSAVLKGSDRVSFVSLDIFLAVEHVVALSKIMLAARTDITSYVWQWVSCIVCFAMLEHGTVHSTFVQICPDFFRWVLCVAHFLILEQFIILVVFVHTVYSSEMSEIREI